MLLDEDQIHRANAKPKSDGQEALDYLVGCNIGEIDRAWLKRMRSAFFRQGKLTEKQIGVVAMIAKRAGVEMDGEELFG